MICFSTRYICQIVCHMTHLTAWAQDEVIAMILWLFEITFWLNSIQCTQLDPSTVIGSAYVFTVTWLLFHMKTVYSDLLVPEVVLTLLLSIDIHRTHAILGMFQLTILLSLGHLSPNLQGYPRVSPIPKHLAFMAMMTGGGGVFTLLTRVTFRNLVKHFKPCIQSCHKLLNGSSFTLTMQHYMYVKFMVFPGHISFFWWHSSNYWSQIISGLYMCKVSLHFSHLV